MTTQRWTCAALAAAAMGTAQAADPVVKLLYAPPFPIPMPVDGAPQKAVIPLPVALAAGMTADKVCVQKTGVRFLNFVDAVVADRFDVASSLGSDKAPAITISVAEPAKLLPGEYQLLMSLVDCKSDGAKAPLDTLTVPLARAGVKLESPGKLTIDRWLATPWSAEASDVKPDRLTIGVTEDSRWAPIAAVQALANPFTMNGSGVNVGAWTLAATRAPAPGQGVVLSLQPREFPIGVASGKIDIGGTDLQAPLRIDVDVRTRLVGAWIVAAVALGTLFGWLLRVWLQHRVDLARARKPAYDELARLRDEVKRSIADRDFVGAVEPPLMALRRALDADDAAAIAAAATAARTAVTTARDKLDASLRDLAQRIDAMAADFDVRAALPPALASVCSAAHPIVVEATRALQRRDAAGASHVLGEGERRLVEQLADAWTTTKANLDGSLRALEALGPLLDKGGREALAAAVAKRRVDRDAIRAPDRAGANALLAGVAQIGREMRETLIWTARALREEADKRCHEAGLRVHNANELDVVADLLRRRTTELADALSAHAGHDAALAPATWQAAAASAGDAGDALLARVVELQTENKRSALQAAVRDKPFDEALVLVPLDDPRLSVRAASVTAAPEIPPASQGFDQPGRAGTFVPPLDVALGDIDAARTRNLAELVRAEGWTAAAVAVLLALASYAIYEDRFLGTWAEMLALFIWGFSADLGADKLASKVKELGTGPKPSA